MLAERFTARELAEMAVEPGPKAPTKCRWSQAIFLKWLRSQPQDEWLGSPESPSDHPFARFLVEVHQGRDPLAGDDGYTLDAAQPHWHPYPDWAKKLEGALVGELLESVTAGELLALWGNLFPDTAEQGDELPALARSNPGFIYILQAPSGVFKIGRARDVARRVQALMTSNSEPLVVWHQLEVPDMVAAEAWLHQRYAAVRSHGEWFRLAPADAAWLKSQTFWPTWESKRP